jgi:hypothetical protein
VTIEPTLNDVSDHDPEETAMRGRNISRSDKICTTARSTLLKSTSCSVASGSR